MRAKRSRRENTAKGRGATSTRRYRPAAADVCERVALVTAFLSLPWLRPEDGAVIAQVHVSTIRRACASGALKCVRVNGGKLFRFTPDALRAWLTPQ